METAKMLQILQKMCRPDEIMAFEHVVRISLNYDENGCDWQSTHYQIVLRFHI